MRVWGLYGHYNADPPKTERLVGLYRTRELALNARHWDWACYFTHFSVRKLEVIEK
jgi:hypothetical protein